MKSPFSQSVSLALVAAAAVVAAAPAVAAPKVVLISLDGGTARFVEQYLTNGVLPANQGIGLLRSKGIHSIQNVTATPSLTVKSMVGDGSAT